MYGPVAAADAYAYEVDPASCNAKHAEVARHAPIAAAAEGPSTISIMVEGRFEEQTVAMKVICEHKDCGCDIVLSSNSLKSQPQSLCSHITFMPQFIPQTSPPP